MIGKPTILVVEDDKYIAGFMAMSLKQEGYPVLSAANAAEGLFLFAGNHPDIVLLDLGLPDQDGLSVIRRLRALALTPIVVVSARGQEQEKIEALDAGADDYVTKPFHMGELLARVRVIERKLNQAGASADNPFEQGDLRVDYEKRRVTVDGGEAHLTPMEYKLLTLLIINKGKVLTHNFIAREVWGYGEMADTRTLRVVMANLRRKIERDTARPEHILTEIGVGYRFADE